MNLTKRPKQLTNAIKIITVWVLIVFVIELVELYLYGVPALTGINRMHQAMTAKTYLFALAVVLILQYLLLLGLWFRKNWVRILYTSLFVIGFFSFLLSLTLRPPVNQTMMFSLAISTITWVLNFYLIVKLFSKESSHWFKSKPFYDKNQSQLSTD